MKEVFLIVDDDKAEAFHDAIKGLLDDYAPLSFEDELRDATYRIGIRKAKDNYDDMKNVVINEVCK